MVAIQMFWTLTPISYNKHGKQQETVEAVIQNNWKVPRLLCSDQTIAKLLNSYQSLCFATGIFG